MGGKAHQRSSSESDDWGDESWIVDCPCGVNYDDGEEMVECDECGVWVHTACCRVPKGLATYMCDKCKSRKKSEEELGVAQLLAESLPSKPVSFDERSHDKETHFISPHHSSREVSMEERAHVHGLPGGDPSLFVGVSHVFCRQLWKNSGYIPKHLSVETNELPEPREDVSEFMRDFLAELALPDRSRKSTPLPLENGHAAHAPPAETDDDTGNKLVVETVSPDGKSFEGEQRAASEENKVERTQNKLVLMAKDHNERHFNHVKRVRDEDGHKEQPIKKKHRSNGETQKPEDRLFVISAHQDSLILSDKSPSSSPKNPKAMKKLAVREFKETSGEEKRMCSGCASAPAIQNVSASDCSRGNSNHLCQNCATVEGNSPAVKKVEADSVKQEVSVSPPSADTKPASTPVLKFYVSRKEMDHRDGANAGRHRESSKPAIDADLPAQTVAKSPRLNDHAEVVCASAVMGTDLASSGAHDREEKKWPLARGPENGVRSRHDQGGAALKVEEKRPASVERLDPCKHCEESTARIEDLQHAGNGLQTFHDDTKYPRTANDTQKIAASDKAVTSERRSPGNSRENPESKSRPPSSGTPGLPVSSNASARTSECAEECKTITTSLKPAMHSSSADHSFEDRARKTVVVKTDGKGLGSARTAGQMPALVRGKSHHVERFVQQSQATASDHNHTSAVQNHGASDQSSLGVQKSSQTSPTITPHLATKESADDGSSLNNHNNQGVVDVDSPGHPPVRPTHHARATPTLQKAPTRCSDTASPSHLPSSQRIENDLQSRPKALQSHSQSRRSDGAAGAAVSPRLLLSSATELDAHGSPSAPTSDGLVIGEKITTVGGSILAHSMSVKSAKSATGPSAVSSNGGPSHTPGAGSSEAPTCAFNVARVSGSIKSPSSGTSSSSPTSPLVMTPSSKPPWNAKTESRPPQRSFSGGSAANASPQQSFSKVGVVAASTNPGSKQAGTLQVSKSVPPGSPSSSKVVSISKQSSKSSSLPVNFDGRHSSGNHGALSASARVGNHITSTGSAKDSVKSAFHSSTKTLATGKPMGPSAVGRPPSSKVSHSHAPKSSSISRQHSGHVLNAAKPAVPIATKHVGAAHHGKSGVSHKDEKVGLSSSVSVSKTNMPPLPHAPLKRSSSNQQTASGAATTLKDEELALLLHQELNSSPRVPRVPRVRQAGNNLHAAPSLSSAKGSNSSAVTGTTHKDHASSRKRGKDDHRKDSSKTTSPSEDSGRSGGKRAEESRGDHGKGSVDKVDHHPGLTEVVPRDKSAGSDSMDSAEVGPRRHGYVKGNLSIVVPGDEDPADLDKGRAVDSSVVTLPGLIDDVLHTRGHLPISYEDVCDAVEPYWPKLRKQNGERYAYASHRQAVLDCLRNRSAWAHLVGRGTKINPTRKRRRMDSSLTDTDDEGEVLSTRDKDALPPCVNAKRWTEMKWDEDEDEDYEYRDPEAAAAEDVPRGRRKARRRRNVAIEDGSDGEDGTENVSARGKDWGSHSGESSPEDDSESESSSSSDEAVSNYSDEEEEVVVQRGTRKRRRPVDESSGSDYDGD